MKNRQFIVLCCLIVIGFCVHLLQMASLVGSIKEIQYNIPSTTALHDIHNDLEWIYRLLKE